MSSVTVTSNSAAIAEEIRQARAGVFAAVADEIAEASIRFQEDLRGPAPGDGLTPFRTGNLQSTGRIEIDGLRLTYTNDARPYRPSNAEQGDRVEIKRGAESYASFAHHAGAEEGQFAADAGAAFEARFGPDLAAKATAAIQRLMP